MMNPDDRLAQRPALKSLLECAYKNAEEGRMLQSLIKLRLNTTRVRLSLLQRAHSSIATLIASRRGDSVTSQEPRLGLRK
jgi:hypothetical protein